MFSEESKAEWGMIEITVKDALLWCNKTTEEKRAARIWASLKTIVYVVHKPSGEPAYVGSTVRGIRRRLAEHCYWFKRSTLGRAMEMVPSSRDWIITIIPCESEPMARLVEKTLIKDIHAERACLLNQYHAEVWGVRAG